MSEKTKNKPVRKLRGMRAEHGLNQRQVATMLRIAPTTYCRKENGFQPFSQREIDILLRAFKVSYEEMFAPQSPATR